MTDRKGILGRTLISAEALERFRTHLDSLNRNTTINLAEASARLREEQQERLEASRARRQARDEMNAVKMARVSENFGHIRDLSEASKKRNDDLNAWDDKAGRFVTKKRDPTEWEKIAYDYTATTIRSAIATPEYKGEWYVGPVPDAYTGAIPSDYTGNLRRLRLDDERKRIYCYEESADGELCKKFVAQTDSPTIAEWIVAARNGRLTGKDLAEAAMEADGEIDRLRGKVMAAHRARAELQDCMSAVQERLRIAYNRNDVLEKEKAGLRAKVEELNEQVNAQKTARLAEVKDAGSRKLRLRSKE